MELILQNDPKREQNINHYDESTRTSSPQLFFHISPTSREVVIAPMSDLSQLIHTSRVPQNQEVRFASYVVGRTIILPQAPNTSDRVG